MTHIRLESVCVDFPVAQHSGHSLKRVVIDKALRIGGRIVETSSTRAVRALDRVSLSLAEGDRIGLIGHNGSGKTTLLRVIAGIYAPSHGSVAVSGRCVSMLDIGIGIDAEATGYENIFMRGLILGMSKSEIAEKTEQIAAFSELGSYLDLPVRTYSSGMAMRLMFSIATAVQGRIVLMDEWLAVGDQDFRRKANDRLNEIADSAGILVVASHEPALLKTLCNKGLLLENGRIKAAGPIGEVLELASEPAA